MKRGFWVSFLALGLFGGLPAEASECFQLARAAPERPAVIPANFTLEKDEVGIRFVAHSSYLIETPEKLQIATDWSGDFEYKLDRQPDVITMNHAHETHWTSFPDPDIEHVLEGWGEKGKPRRHFLRLGETLIRNVPTDIRSEYAGVEPFGNSIFLFEAAGLCIGHLGHIHHIPTEEQFALLGRIDILMVPVDGTFTLGVEELLPLMKRLKSQVVLPMHSFGGWSLTRFLAGMKDDFRIERMESDDLVFSLKTLPKEPTVYVPKSL